MIAYLIGKFTSFESGQAIINVQGVGYLVFITDKTAYDLQTMQSQKGEVELFIETHIREDHIHLFGFLDLADRDAFRMLSTVQGVGNKVALSILQALDANQLQAAFLSEDTDAFTKIPGIGKKLASRIISELKDKNVSDRISINAPNKTDQKENHILNDSLSALVNLGYDKSQAYQALVQILQDKPNTDTADAIRLALQQLSNR